MAKRIDVTDFAYGETLDILLQAKDRDDLDLDLTGGTATLSIAANFQETTPLLEFKTGDPEVTVIDALTGQVRFLLPKAAYNLVLSEATDYYYTLWTTIASGIQLHQVGGKLHLGGAVQKS